VGNRPNGESSAELAPALRAGAKTQNVTILDLAVGIWRDVLTPWCDGAHGAGDLSTVETLFAS
jgi:hypothetical protein